MAKCSCIPACEPYPQAHFISASALRLQNQRHPILRQRVNQRCTTLYNHPRCNSAAVPSGKYMHSRSQLVVPAKACLSFQTKGVTFCRIQRCQHSFVAAICSGYHMIVIYSGYSDMPEMHWDCKSQPHHALLVDAEDLYPFGSAYGDHSIALKSWASRQMFSRHMHRLSRIL
jgi:hypothetical protein